MLSNTKPGEPKKSVSSVTITGAALILLLSTLVTKVLASPINDAIDKSELRFGGEAFQAELYRENGRLFVEVEVLAGNRIIEVEYDVRTGRITDSEAYRSNRRVARVAAALERSRLTLYEAVQIADNAAGPGNVREAKLRLSRQAKRNGKRFIVELRNEEGLFDVILNSRDGRVVRIRPDEEGHNDSADQVAVHF